MNPVIILLVIWLHMGDKAPDVSAVPMDSPEACMEAGQAFVDQMEPKEAGSFATFACLGINKTHEQA